MKYILIESYSIAEGHSAMLLREEAQMTLLILEREEVFLVFENVSSAYFA